MQEANGVAAWKGKLTPIRALCSRTRPAGANVQGQVKWAGALGKLRGPPKR